jgi:alpha-ribazole phosphatase
MKVTAVRHGETEGNIKRIVQSHTGGRLTERGCEQARQAGKQLAGEKFDAIYVSDLRRCIETIEIMLPNAPYVRTAQLRERSNGIYDGRSWDDLPTFIFEGSDIVTRVEGGESWLDIEARIAEFINELYAQYPDGHVLLITHGGPIKVLRSLIEGLTLQEAAVDMVSNAGSWRGEVIAPVQPTVVT